MVASVRALQSLDSQKKQTLKERILGTTPTVPMIPEQMVSHSSGCRALDG